MAGLRKMRSDKTVKSIEKELGVSMYKKDGTKQPKNKVLGTIRKEEEILSVDQKAASKRIVKVHPKSNPSTVKKVVKSLKTIKK
ncbi:hypothetical protein A2467_02350 [Candidatus Nomurabacteria bacterium RIFOXYC2_FULL_36_8]|nr:MAG: hypothetical protein US00_C0006G0063 [Candidatus Nomurabacteria bacterium GW2011_GWF2_36_126]KKP97132.1 MAG: hypothetical protein US04_C0001G0635 [Candidatus Nomurabacteria bacterium GW2011_GWD2_36_14]KKP99259.1 MAG: hypothetical protein US08_C0002G0082 [Candidatus Nomurabacteria bacterium GW2011_GWF2_36_19]KKQ05906.1 MAG: hypothetical protein US17_C0001G0084 [Candidatus Nomurabacteria bacterium GW2011_GWF1_36_47]KKQ09399.1 MAG: hypothetical protein US21_C0005G0056 [Candidatus Nomurabac